VLRDRQEQMAAELRDWIEAEHREVFQRSDD